MVKLNLKWLKNFKLLILIISIFLIVFIESKSQLIEVQDFSEIKFHNVKGGLAEIDAGKENALSSFSTKTPRYIKARSDGSFMAFNNQINLQKDTEVENLIVSDKEFHSKLIKGSVEIYSLNEQDKFSFQTGDFVLYPKGATHILVGEKGVRVLKGTVLIFEFKDGVFDKSFVLTRNQGVGSVADSSLADFENLYLDKFFQMTNRGYSLNQNFKQNFLLFNNQKKYQLKINQLKDELQKLVLGEGIDQNLLSEINLEILKDDKFKTIVQDSFENFIKAYLLDGKSLNPGVKKLFIKDDEFFNKFSKIQISFLLLDELAELKNKKRINDFNDSSIIFLNLIDRFKKNLNYNDRHTMILTLNSILKNKNFWEPAIFETRHLLYIVNLSNLQDDLKINYEKDFQKQNLNLLANLFEDNKKVKNSRDVAEVLMQDLSQNQKLEFVDKLFDL